MSSNHGDQLTIREYLLGQLNEDSSRAFEQRLLTDDGFYEELLVGEDELIDQYLAGELKDRETAMFHANFLSTRERQQKLSFARAFKKYAAVHANEQFEAQQKRSLSQPSWGPIFTASPWRAVALAAVILLAVTAVWRVFIYRSDVDKGLIALNNAYREQRPLESRITKLDYAPFVVTRGGEAPRVDSRERDVAERYLLDAVRDHPGGASYHALGKFYLAERNFDKAIAQFEEALKVEPNNALIYADLGAAFLEKGKRDQTASNIAQAQIEFGRSHENLSKALELNPNLMEALFNRAICRENLKLSEQAEADWRQYLQKDANSQWANEARQHLEKLKAETIKATQNEQQLREDFLSAFQNKDDEKSWETLKHGRTRGGNLIVNALVLDYLAFAANDQADAAADRLRQISYAGSIEEAKVKDRHTADLAKFYQTVTAIDRAALNEAHDLLRTATERYNRGEFDEASGFFSQAKDKFAALRDEPEALVAEAWIGYCQLRTLAVKSGVELFERLVPIFERKHYLALAAQALQALGDAQSSLAEFSKALAIGDKALALSDNVEDEPNSIRCLALMISMHLALSDYQQSLQLFARAAQLGRSIPHDPKLMWPAYYEAGLDFHFMGLPVTAVAFEKEALSLANAADVPLLRSRSLERLGTLYSEQKNFPEAIKSGEQALAEAEEITSERSRNAVRAHAMLRLARSHGQAGNLPKAVYYLDQSLELYKKLDSQLYLYEASKGKLLAHIEMHDQAAAAELPVVVDLFEKNRARITAESQRDKFFDAGQDIYDVAVAFSYKQNAGADKAFDYAEASRARSLFEMMNTGVRITDIKNPEIHLEAESHPLPAGFIRERMPQQSQILEYAVLADKIVIWVVTRSAVKTGESSITSADLDGRIRNFVSTLAQPSGTSLEAVARQGKELHSLLIAPIEKYLDRNLVVCVVPDKSLNYVPFEALMSETSGRYLIEDYKLQRSPSATVFVELSDQAKKRERTALENLLSVGNPAFDQVAFSSLADLPGAKREAEQISNFYHPATRLLGPDATTARVMTALPNADVVHFATHAVADERSPLLSKLLLAHAPSRTRMTDATDGVLQAADVYGMKLARTHLVVLSACQTGIEHAYRGEGAIGFARPFLAAGVPLVVASLWPVDSEATADLMISFHKFRTEQKLPTVEALRNAQLAYLHNPQKDPHGTFSWAAFTTIGGYAVY
jgi:CHAT domain-containing protein